MFVVDQSIKVCPAILRTCLTSLKKKKKKKKTALPGKKWYKTAPSLVTGVTSWVHFLYICEQGIFLLPSKVSLNFILKRSIRVP